MGQKVNPHGLRVGIIKDWDSRWFASKKDFSDKLVADYKLRKFVMAALVGAGVPKIEIERKAGRILLKIHCSKPGRVIGKGGAELEKLRLNCEKMAGETVSIDIVEIKNPSINAQLVADDIAASLEKRVSFRRAMKQAMFNSTRGGARGIKTMVSGRLGGAEIARVEHYHEGTIPLQTLRADIDYGFTEARTTYGRIGVKVWIYKGEVLMGAKKAKPEPTKEGGTGNVNAKAR